MRKKFLNNTPGMWMVHRVLGNLHSRAYFCILRASHFTSQHALLFLWLVFSFKYTITTMHALSLTPHYSNHPKHRLSLSSLYNHLIHQHLIWSLAPAVETKSIYSMERWWWFVYKRIQHNLLFKSLGAFAWQPFNNSAMMWKCVICHSC